MKLLSTIAALILGSLSLLAADFKVHSLSPQGELVLTNTYDEGVVTILEASDPTGPWPAAKNIVTTGPAAAVDLPMTSQEGFFTAKSTDLTPDLPNGRNAFTNLTRVYGLMTTIAGRGTFRGNNESFWQPSFEGGPATNADLSRPHIAMADDAGNIYIADKNAHAIRMVRPDGVIVTVAGINSPGDAPDTPTVATEAALNEPNGLWVQPDGTVYILDLVNSKIRKLDTNGMLSTVVTDLNTIFGGRGLIVNDDGSELFYSASFEVRKWTLAEGISTFATGFTQLGYLHRNPVTDEVVATDRGGNLVWRIESDGEKAPIAGNGGQLGGGDGAPALQTALYGVRTVWFLPTGAYFVGTHEGNQMWYVDTSGHIHLFVNGAGGATHAGDGTWFYNPLEPRMSELRAITMDRDGNLLVTESDYGYVRKIEFLPMPDQD